MGILQSIPIHVYISIDISIDICIYIHVYIYSSFLVCEISYGCEGRIRYECEGKRMRACSAPRYIMYHLYGLIGGCDMGEAPP